MSKALLHLCQIWRLGIVPSFASMHWPCIEPSKGSECLECSRVRMHGTDSCILPSIYRLKQGIIVCNCAMYNCPMGYHWVHTKLMSFILVLRSQSIWADFLLEKHVALDCTIYGLLHSISRFLNFPRYCFGFPRLILLYPVVKRGGRSCR